MSTEHEVASNDPIERKSVICLFDVDGTLTYPRQVKHNNMTCPLTVL